MKKDLFYQIKKEKNPELLKFFFKSIKLEILISYIKYDNQESLLTKIKKFFYILVRPSLYKMGIYRKLDEIHVYEKDDFYKIFFIFEKTNDVYILKNQNYGERKSNLPLGLTNYEYYKMVYNGIKYKQLIDNTNE